MATRAETVQYIVDQANLGRRLEYRKMFGEYALYVDGKVAALVCDDQCFLKPTPEGQRYLGTVIEGAPYPGAKPHFVLVDELEDPDRFAQALTITAAALPPPKPKLAKPKTSKKQLSSRRR